MPRCPPQANSVDLSEAVDLLNKAVARDPNFFLAYCQLAFVHDLIYQQETTTPPLVWPWQSRP